MGSRVIETDDLRVGGDEETYIIAEIGSNFDGSKQRAEKLIELASECGANAAKFQAFETDKILSKVGFEGLNKGFQSDWDKPAYEVYRDAELPRDWIADLAGCAEANDIDFLCTPYDRAAVDQLEDYVPMYKIGSGDITWHDYLEYVAEKGKPIILSTGASTLAEVDEAVEAIQATGNTDIVLLQCVTNYPSRFESANIRAMDTFQQAFDVPVGYSDHTPGRTVPIGAVSRGGRMIEKHFTDDTSRDGPDHPHSLNPEEFNRLVTEIRNLENALGSPRKRVYEEEQTPIVLQRRAMRAATNIQAGETITDEMLTALRPAPAEAIEPNQREEIVGRDATTDIAKGEIITWQDI